jgi:hypothetical protein
LVRRSRVVVAGYLVRFPIGGYVWQALHYLLGFERLGCEVFFYEDSAYDPLAYDPRSGASGEDYAFGVRRLGEVLGEFGFAGRWTFWDARRNEFHGRSREETRRCLAEADLLVNLAGVNRLGEWPLPPARIYLDIDPAFTQIRLENQDARLGGLLAEHNLFFTFGENIGTSRSPLPTGGIDWRPTRPPVVADLWDDGPSPPPGAAFTTIGRWDAAERDVEFRGVRYHWRKSVEWRKFLDLPERTGERFELAMDVERVPRDRQTLAARGWELRPPLAVSADLFVYRRYIQASKGEFSAAKGMNVRLRSGWFSDRSACYLAAGRPVVVEDTGFGDLVPTGRGLFAVRGLADAVEAFAAIAADYAAHAAAARAVARAEFEATRVLRPLLEAAGC